MTNKEIVDLMVKEAKEQGREIPDKLIKDYLGWDNKTLQFFYDLSRFCD